MDAKTNTLQGKMELDLNTLMHKKDMEALGESYSLMGSTGGLASVKLTCTLRVWFIFFLI